jgi:osmotically inducible lipoprotein OsmB
MRASKIMSIASVMTIAVGLSACGTTQGERAATGAGLGAGAGLLGGAALGHPLGGALVGGAAGAATGAFTSHHDLNFGKPIWKWGD